MPPAPSAIFRAWNFNQPINTLALNRNGDHIAIALADGSLRLLPASDEAEQPKEIPLHNGVSLSLESDADAHGFLSGGDDGKVFLIDPVLDTPTLLVEHKNKWIDHVAASTDGKYRAYTTGKEIHVLDAEGQTLATHTAPSSLGGLAFAPNSKRLAASHYNGVSLYWLNAKESAPSKLIWKGSHLGLIWHPDGKMILSSLQEGALHGWRLSDNHEMRMQGYATKVHSLSFTAKGKYLVTSGAEQMIAWPFFGGGPWGKEPLAVGGMDSRLVTRVAAHPKDDLVAVGHEDGMITLAPLDGRMEILIQPPQGREAGIVGLGWNHAGDCLFAALENGMLLLFTVDSVRMAVTGTA